MSNVTLDPRLVSEPRSTSQIQSHHAADENVVEHWLKKDPKRWIAGGLAGIFAGLLAMGVAMFLAASLGGEIWFPLKLAASALLGPSATEFGFNPGVLLTGLFFHEVIAGVFGFVFAHFVWTNAVRALLAMGLVWGAFSWVFLWNLFGQSFQAILWMRVSSGAAFVFCMVYGLGLASVTLFDRWVRGN